MAATAPKLVFSHITKNPTRWTRKLVWIAASGKGRKPSDEAIRRAHLDHLAEKHQ
jgi:hypothetical protein